MGSLMAGWQTNPEDAKEAFKRSTSSVTREEVQRFWKAKKEMVEKHLAEIQRDANEARSVVLPVSPGTESGSSHSGSVSWSPPITPTTPSSAAQESASPKSPGWWQKSYWAFLNEPPLVADRQNRYVAQYDVRGPLKLDSDDPAASNIRMQHTRSSVN